MSEFGTFRFGDRPFDDLLGVGSGDFPIATQALYVPQTSGGIALPTPITLSGDFTIEAWVRFEDGEHYSINNNLGICSGSITTQSTTFDINFFAGAPRLYADRDGRDRIVADTIVSKGVWYHIAFVRSGGQLFLYINGVLDKVDTRIWTSEVRIDYLAQSVTNTTGLEGRLDEYRVWTVDRTEQEITDYYNKRVDPSSEGLEAYWRFDNNYIDLTGNGRDLTTAFDVFEDGAPIVVVQPTEYDRYYDVRTGAASIFTTSFTALQWFHHKVSCEVNFNFDVSGEARLTKTAYADVSPSWGIDFGYRLIHTSYSDVATEFSTEFSTRLSTPVFSKATATFAALFDNTEVLDSKIKWARINEVLSFDVSVTTTLLHVVYAPVTTDYRTFIQSSSVSTHSVSIGAVFNVKIHSRRLWEAPPDQQGEVWSPVMAVQDEGWTPSAIPLSGEMWTQRRH